MSIEDYNTIIKLLAVTIGVQIGSLGVIIMIIGFLIRKFAPRKQDQV